MINFNQLRVFYQVAENLNLTRAADKLFISQPAVTAQIKRFEDSCNLKLFKKGGRKIYLTEEGKTLHEYARKIFAYEREVEDVIEDMRKLKRGYLQLGTTKTYARYFMPFLMTRFHDAYPYIKISLNEGSSLDMTHSLLDFKNEVAIISKVEENPHICFIPFVREDLVLIVKTNHLLAGEKTVSFAELAEEPIIMKETGSGTRKLINELFARNSFTPKILMETSNTELIKQLVQRGEGISFLTKVTVAQELQEKKLATVPLKDQEIPLESFVAYLKDEHLSPPAKAFLEILKRLTPRDRTFYDIEDFMVRQ
jgi:DNA-binding transcriptional LysR family regulator